MKLKRFDLGQYFKYHLLVKLRVTPAPTNFKESYHIYQNFMKLGYGIDFFTFSQSGSKLIPYGNTLTILFNPISNTLALDPFLELVVPIDSKNYTIKYKELSSTLNRLCALTRYSYIEHDENYRSGKLEAPFKYVLSKLGLKYEGLYSLSSASAKDQFIRISPNGPGPTSMNPETLQDFRRHIRYNFQKFHKFECIHVSPAVRFFDKSSFNTASLEREICDVEN